MKAQDIINESNDDLSFEELADILLTKILREQK